jgi:hypothetical protein
VYHATHCPLPCFCSILYLFSLALYSHRMQRIDNFDVGVLIIKNCTLFGAEVSMDNAGTARLGRILRALGAESLRGALLTQRSGSTGGIRPPTAYYKHLARPCTSQIRQKPGAHIPEYMLEF